eukprot:g2494.t1
MSSCPSGLPGTDLLVGEELISTVRIVTTLVSITVTSAWFSKEKIKKLSLFFAHWLSGLVAGMVVLAEGTMVSACWTGREFAGLMRALKFIGLSAFNMYAITNLAICINLAFIVSGKNPYVKVSFFYVEMFVGICMFVVGGWLLLFRLNEAKETWKIHVRIRFYFVLTLIGIAVNITVGVCGVINFLADDIRYLPIMLSATFRYMHIALDTLALYGALRDKTTDGGEPLIATVRILTTLISLTVTSSWFNREKIRKLSLFFAHWLSGLVAGMVVLAEGTMVAACWTGREFEGLMRALKFIGLTAFNMYAITNLAICINLALIVSSHRTLSLVRSVTSSRLLLAFLFTSVALAAPVLALAETVRISRTGFHVTSLDQNKNYVVKISFFYVEFFVGLCMSAVVIWLLIFRMKEVKECWNLHVRIRFYFALTLIGIAVNTTIGVCGTINFLSDDIR